MGSGIGSVPVQRLVAAIGEVMKATVPGGFQIATGAVPLAEVENVWNSAESIPRIVFQIP
jgi:hypothetical protein